MNPVRREIDADRRWFILDAIAQMETRSLNEQLVLRSIQSWGRPANVEDIRNDLLLLERAECLKLEKLQRSFDGTELWVATLTTAGLQTRDCVRTVHGVAARRPL